ncbi:MAG: DUF885 domain-containing protein [Erythrobacter sp.]|uniref:DUF885 domain-containing protein n=1 Tax=Erythrobacter sp. TaxID=1042 RepID=UPI00260E229D|nr:DUF885 domain-containing protein [Erythrobacter sp.]MDJ0977407.1 DUF885 domain-containing protein [Erythrobacter sp.]
MRFLACVALLLSALSVPVKAGPLEDFIALREEVWQQALDDDPLLATNVGDRRGDGSVGDLSLEAYERQVAQTRAFLARLQAIDASQLPVSERIDYAVVKSDFEDKIEASAHDQTRFVLFTTYSGWFSSFASLPFRSPLFTEADYASYLDRLAAFPVYNRNGIERSRKAVDLGMTQACGPLEGFGQKIAALVVEDPESSVFWEPFLRQRPTTISSERWEALKATARKRISDDVTPAYRELLDFYTQEYAPNCRDGLPGVSQTPGGAAYYAHRVKSFTTTQLTPDEVHRLGLSEVARIRAEMDKVAASAGYESREAYIDHLRSDPAYYMTDAEEYVSHVAALAKTIDGFMPQLFTRLPRNPYTVKPIPAANAPGTTTAYYEPGSLAAGRSGVYRINTTKLDQRPLWELPALSAHEAVPGHHLQISLQQEMDLHPLRANTAYFTAFVEGWGLYSERLGIEMGLYDTPAKQMGRLSYEMWRASRLVVDTGIHSKGWTKEQAVDFMLANTALSAANIDAEVNRYITWPGQALAYKVGELKIRDLRARAEKALGADFDLRAFHDAVLENGSVPLSVLEEHMDGWIRAEQMALDTRADTDANVDLLAEEG